MEMRGTGIFVFSDPGGAKAVLSQAYLLQQNLSSLHVYSDREYPFVKHFDLQIKFPPEDIDHELKFLKPDFVYAATSYTSPLELKFIRAALKAKIPCAAFIDHWTRGKDRFFLDNGYVFPNEILVIDERAKHLFTEEGLDPSRLRITGNPYHQFLKKWAPKTTRESFFQSLGIHPQTKLVLFAPEPLSNVNGAETFGFDEVKATAEFVHVVSSLQTAATVAIKAHPNQNFAKLRTVAHETLIFTDETADPLTLIYFADAIVGMFSSLLVEAAVMGKKVLRFHPLPAKNDPLEGSGVGKVVDGKALITELHNALG